MKSVPSFQSFMGQDKFSQISEDPIEQANLTQYEELVKPESTYFIETYGWQMNFADTEVVQAVLENNGYTRASWTEDANVVFAMTWAIREKAEQRIWNKIGNQYKGLKRKDKKKVIGILGWMAERLREKLVDNQYVDIVAGPDAYRDIPNLINIIKGTDHVEEKPKAINVQLSFDETYADIIPVRKEDNGLHAWVSIMRGWNNMCTFCIVPFTRGRERSRPIYSILDEVQHLRDSGYKDITLLGQNVNR